MRRSLAALLLLFILLPSGTLYAKPEQPVRLMLNDTPYETIIGQPAIYVDRETQRVMVPLRAILKVLPPINSKELYWEAPTKTLTIAPMGEDAVPRFVFSLQAGQSYFMLNEERVEMGVQAEIRDGTLFLPLRSIGEAFGVEVQWDERQKLVHVRSGDTW